MDSPKYKVEFLPFITGKKKWHESKPVTYPIKSAHQMEQLILQYDEAGYDLFSQVGINDYKSINSSYSGSYTTGIMITFKKRI